MKFIIVCWYSTNFFPLLWVPHCHHYLDNCFHHIFVTHHTCHFTGSTLSSNPETIPSINFLIMPYYFKLRHIARKKPKVKNYWPQLQNQPKLQHPLRSIEADWISLLVGNAMTGGCWDDGWIAVVGLWNLKRVTEYSRYVFDAYNHKNCAGNFI